ncbi:hypothetical protein DPMN_181539 [Dreissena polymorpha]|uniref:Uncharacterized protein n=1 Tax=Dreissena polymorpha TaxID=45954 RepID=A0A9D4I5E6_DREPO|nr:hypothetical protein DPMN_181539 [Dreissena polymorpha]
MHVYLMELHILSEPETTPNVFKLILNLSYGNTDNLNYAWPHYQPWGAPPTLATPTLATPTLATPT